MNRTYGWAVEAAYALCLAAWTLIMLRLVGAL